MGDGRADRVYRDASIHYCDRGRWLLNADSKDPTKITLDWADGFPRYYFEDECLLREMKAWLFARGQFGSMKDNPARYTGI